jgi:phosphoribosylanthranilate isomerase
MTAIKICGMKYRENIVDALKLKPNYMGFIFYPNSPRYVGVDFSLENISFQNTLKVGVFVDEGLDTIQKIAKQHELDAVQLHGNESNQICEALKKDYIVIKTISVGEKISLSQLDDYYPVIDYFLFDTKTSKHGGSGKCFNWSLLDNTAYPYFLSGGLNNDNLFSKQRPKTKSLIGIDVNSHYELKPGLKDIRKLKRLFDHIQNENRN